jgi:AcrR family transcriptional regulator
MAERQSRKSYDRSMSADERGAEQRARIIRAATELYGERGYHETRVDDVVARARVSRRTLYAHFRDLVELRFAVYEGAMSRTLLQLGILAQDESQPDRLASVLTAMFEFIASEPNLSRAVASEFRSTEPRNLALRNQVLAFFVGILMEGTLADHRDGRVPHPPEELTVYALVGAIEGLVYRFLDRGDVEDASKAVPVALHVYRSVYPWRPK